MITFDDEKACEQIDSEKGESTAEVVESTEEK